MNLERHSDPVARLTELDPTLDRRRAIKLLDVATRHALRWEVWPERHLVGSEVQQVGFELDLPGQHAAHVHPSAPGCEACQQVYVALLDVARFLIPKGLHPSRYEIEPFNGALRYAGTSSQSYVTLKLRILHRDDKREGQLMLDQRVCAASYHHRHRLTPPQQSVRTPSTMSYDAFKRRRTIRAAERLGDFIASQ